MIPRRLFDLRPVLVLHHQIRPRGNDCLQPPSRSASQLVYPRVGFGRWRRPDYHPVRISLVGNRHQVCGLADQRTSMAFLFNRCCREFLPFLRSAADFKITDDGPGYYFPKRFHCRRHIPHPVFQPFKQLFNSPVFGFYLDFKCHLTNPFLCAILFFCRH